MTLSSDHEIVRGRRWSKRTRVAAVAICAPLCVYAPGFVMALPQGVATSLPFWAEAPDYTCSSTPARSLMVRVQPYSSKAAAPKASAGERACMRIQSFAESDLIGADRGKADNGQRYVRIYTPPHSDRAHLPDLATPDDMSSRVILLRGAPPRAHVGDGKPKS